MTIKQLQVLRFIADRVAQTGISPTLAEIADNLGVRSRVTALQHVRSLEAAGHIRRERYGKRGIEVVRIPEPTGACPVCGRRA